MSPRRSTWREVPLLVLAAVVLALLLKALVVQAFVIPSGSMEQTLHGCPGCRGDRVLVEKVGVRLHGVRRGEVVVFDGRGSWGRSSDAAPAANPVLRRLGLGDDGEDYVKRVVGLPGDRVACCSAAGHVTVQPAGSDRPRELVEPYLFQDGHQAFCAAGLGPQACPPGSPGVLVPPGRLWLMGDHRSDSADSRYHLDDAHSGTVAVDHVVGRAVATVWPPSRVRLLRVPPSLLR